jgi:hypothetical protein
MRRAVDSTPPVPPSLLELSHAPADGNLLLDDRRR